MIPEFIAEKFITRLYTIEYDGKIGGQTLRLYADDYVKPVFCHTHGIVWQDINDVAKHIKQFENYKPFFSNNPVVYEYSMNGNTVTKIIVATAENLMHTVG